ncbi:MAG TPA: hypothetical protein VG273_16465 [Bryobacteraceae bacterium]|jgi:membrane protease subunit (stomatin/prohibitin family)|nr:hypothetical protein [Bryobacteraceae bacterium]
MPLLNVIDYSAAQKALENVENQTVKDIGTQLLPALQAVLNATLAGATATIEETVGGALRDLTAERMEVVDQVHGILDRLNGTHLAFTAGGFELQIPERK